MQRDRIMVIIIFLGISAARAAYLPGGRVELDEPPQSVQLAATVKSTNVVIGSPAVGAQLARIPAVMTQASPGR